jgi:hypothetical protein
MPSVDGERFRTRRLTLLYVLFFLVLAVVFFGWALSGSCENFCGSPPNLARKLAFLILGAVFAAAGACVKIRSRSLAATVLWMLGAVLLFYGLLITMSSSG